MIKEDFSRRLSMDTDLLKAMISMETRTTISMDRLRATMDNRQCNTNKCHLKVTMWTTGVQEQVKDAVLPCWVR